MIFLQKLRLRLETSLFKEHKGGLDELPPMNERSDSTLEDILENRKPNLLNALLRRCLINSKTESTASCHVSVDLSTSYGAGWRSHELRFMCQSIIFLNVLFPWSKAMNFTIGDVVTLKSGSPRLTVIKIVNQAVTCVHFRNGEFKIFEFPFEALELLRSYQSDSRFPKGLLGRS